MSEERAHRLVDTETALKKAMEDFATARGDRPMWIVLGSPPSRPIAGPVIFDRTTAAESRGETLCALRQLVLSVGQDDAKRRKVVDALDLAIGEANAGG